MAKTLNPSAALRRPSAVEAGRDRHSVRDRVARNLLLARHVLNVTQETLAAKAGVARATIAQIEGAHADTRIGTLVDLAQVLDTAPVLLFFSEGEINALVRTIDRNHIDKLLARVPGSVIEQMWSFKETGLPRNLLKIARLGAEIARHADHGSRSARVGAAIGSVIQPGLGTVVGMLYGDAIDPSAAAGHGLVEYGEGI